MFTEVASKVIRIGLTLNVRGKCPCRAFEQSQKLRTMQTFTVVDVNYILISYETKLQC